MVPRPTLIGHSDYQTNFRQYKLNQFHPPFQQGESLEQNPQKITSKALSAYLTGELPSMKQTNGRHHGNHYQLKTIIRSPNSFPKVPRNLQTAVNSQNANSSQVPKTCKLLQFTSARTSAATAGAKGTNPAANSICLPEMNLTPAATGQESK